MSEANKHQVGGTHYQSDYQVWDFILHCGLGYLEGQTIRYLQRWDKKGDPENDLRKADHYIQKLMESIYISRDPRRNQNLVREEVNRFGTANKLEGYTLWAVQCVAQWQTIDDLQMARRYITHLLQVIRGEFSNED